MTLILFILLIFYSLPHSSNATELIPFDLPWDDSSDSIPNVSHLLDKPAGKHGFIRADGERFINGDGKPFHILGVNTAFAGNFPTHEQAEKVAARMAKFGINAVRIHHLDTMRAPSGIWLEGTPEKQKLDEERLDRLDYFIAQFKQNGIYTNLNLKVGRKTVEADGVPHANDLPTYDKGPDHFYPRLIELQKEYARDLLTHVNPYTGNNYLNEPAIVTIEINNESGLVWQWANRSLDGLPPEYLDVLQKDWNAFLLNKYGNTGDLIKAWTPESKGDGKEMLSDSLDSWIFQTVEQAKGTKEIQENDHFGKPAVEMNITNTGNQSWHVQLFYPQLALKQNEYYQVSMRLRADPPRIINVGLQQNHEPWQQLEQPVQIDVTNEWKEYHFSFSPNETDQNARLILSGLGNQTGKVWMPHSSMMNKAPEVLGEGESLEKETIAVVLRIEYGAKTASCKRDWMEFLVQRETQYNQEMYNFLKHDLGAQSMVTGTQIGFALYTSQMMHDLIDTHGYFNHPHFPNRQWDAEDWYVENESIVNQENNVLQQLMERQVAGKPFTVSEYNHPAPMPFASEVIPLTAAYGAFQGWDGIYFFAYSHNNNYEDKSINSFFDIAGHTPKMLCMPAAANMLIRGDIQLSNSAHVVHKRFGDIVDYLTANNGGLWNLHQFTRNDRNAEITYTNKTLVNISHQMLSNHERETSSISKIFESSTEELVWNIENPEAGFVLIRSPKTKGLIGFAVNQPLDLMDGVQLEIGDTQENWANVLLTWMKSSDEGEHWLLTATGYSENSGMKWKDEKKNSVGRNWGDGPPLVEPVPLRLAMPAQTITIPGMVYPLNERGQRIPEQSIEMKRAGNNDILQLDKTQTSLWYEIVMPNKP